MSQVIENTTDEAFALNQWLSDYPYDMTYEEIIDCLTNDEYLDSDNIVVWELIEEYSGRQIASLIDETRMAFQRATNGRKQWVS